MIMKLWQHFELLIWLGALVLLYFLDVEQEHFSLCVINALGFSWCPGCGIGHSIHYALQLDFSNAWREHYFGIPATGIILFRTGQLVSPLLNFKKHKNGTTDL